jgi:hypothetical protein
MQLFDVDSILYGSKGNGLRIDIYGCYSWDTRLALNIRTGNEYRKREDG